MAEKLEIIITADDQVSGKLGGISDSLGNLGKKMTTAGKAMTLGITAPLVAMGTMAVMAASDFEEAANKVDVVFGDAAGSIHSFADDAATSLGMSSAAALEAAGTYGNLFVSMGIGQEEASGMSTELLQLAADLASFNNIDPTVALEKLRAGLTGETEPLKTLGVNLNQVAIKAKALELGLIDSTVNMPKMEAATIKLSKAEAEAAEVIKEYGQDSEEAQEALNKVALAEQGLAGIMEGKTGEMDAAAKAQAAYALILEQTTTAQGDFERTSDGLANTMRIIKASFGDVAAELGTVLLPIVTQFATWLKTLLEKFQGLSPETQKMIVIFAAIAAAIGPLLLIVGSLVSALGTILPVIATIVGVLSGPILLVIGLVVGAITLLALAWKNNWGDIQGKTQVVVDWLRDKIGAFIRWMREFWDEHGEKILAIVRALWDGVMKVFNHFKDQAQRVFDLFRLAFEGDWEGFGKKLREIWDEAWSFIVETFKTVSKTLATLAYNLGFAIGEKIRSIDWKQLGIDILTWIGNGMLSLNTWLWETALKIVAWIVQKIREVDWLKLGKDIILGIGNGLLTLNTWLWGIITNLMRSMVEKIREVDWGQVGKNIIIGIGNGLLALSNWLLGMAWDIARDLFNVFKDFFGIQSPSSLMEKAIGINLGKGIRSGLIKSLKDIDMNMNVLTGAASSVGQLIPVQSTYSTAGGGARNININFSGPVYGDPYELERMILPIVEKGIRADKARS